MTFWKCSEKSGIFKRRLAMRQRKHAHYKTVNLGSCAYCAYFGLCTSHVKYDGNPIEGFVRLTDIHPELGV